MVKLVGTDIDKIIFEANNLIRNKNIYKHMSSLSNLYGDGKTSIEICNILVEYFTT